MKKKTILFITYTILILNTIIAQEKNNIKSEIGLNLLQLTTTTIDLNYRITNNPRYSLNINTGYTFNYSNSFKLIALFGAHNKLLNYDMIKQSGRFVNIGFNYNFRNNYQKKNYLYIGASVNNSFIYENAEYREIIIQGSQVENLTHNLYIFGFSTIAGYNFNISDRLSSDIGLKISVPNNKVEEMYGYYNYIPGMGYKNTQGSNNRIFPMLLFNLNYKID